MGAAAPHTSMMVTPCSDSQRCMGLVRWPLYMQ